VSTAFEVLTACEDDDSAVSGPRHVLTAAGLVTAADLLGEVDTRPSSTPCDALAWAAAGGMWLTGPAGGPPLPPPVPLLARLTRIASAVETLSGALGNRVTVDVAELLFGRAALEQLSRRGRVSAGGTCRLLATADGWIAVNLARPEDATSVPAIIGHDHASDPWTALDRAATDHAATELVERCTLVGVPAAALPADAGVGRDPFVVERLGNGRPPGERRAPVVVDLSAMWAGPVCAQLLGRAGARVIKVESRHRPDGARRGNRAFFDWLHRGHESVVLDFRDRTEVAQLRALLDRADVVIESSRPRALRQLGVDAAEIAARPGCAWISITGYGRQGDHAMRVAFGDDAAVAGGLVATDPAGDPVFCGDAIADPITGLYAAMASLAALIDGGGGVIDVAMQAVAAHVSRPATATAHRLIADQDGVWTVQHGDRMQRVLPPREPAAVSTAP